ncbi:MAG: hypothetical protein M0Z45_01020 [Actinomycetota bacterium]|nr:hypothetical protein [Actinomycetota bacterium]
MFNLAKEAKLAQTLEELVDALVAGFDVVVLPTFLTHRSLEILSIAAAGL